MTNLEWGHPCLAQYLVGRRYCPEKGMLPFWKDMYMGSIESAQIQYDRGDVELCQARWRDERNRLWFLLYAIPRKERRRIHLNYFGTSMVRSAS